mmetsp:Transcript_18869/g.49862  ORF Transcript_18869/g.49862 Transcript_18869/m.49862 type:complete len:179 (-) Transcript_18869:71-607(-)
MFAGPLKRSAAAALRLRAAPVAPRLALARPFATSPLEKTAKLYEDLVAKSVKEFEANKAEVSANLDAELSANKMVLFMEGTPDAPKSEASLNVIRMLTQAQCVPFLSVDVLTHPAVLGYTVSKSQKSRGPHLYVNGSFFGDHDSLLAKYSTGELMKDLGTEATKSKGTFGGELPIATY